MQIKKMEGESLILNEKQNFYSAFLKNNVKMYVPCLWEQFYCCCMHTKIMLFKEIVVVKLLRNWSAWKCSEMQALLSVLGLSKPYIAGVIFFQQDRRTNYEGNWKWGFTLSPILAREIRLVIAVVVEP